MYAPVGRYCDPRPCVTHTDTQAKHVHYSNIAPRLKPSQQPQDNKCVGCNDFLLPLFSKDTGVSEIPDTTSLHNMDANVHYKEQLRPSPTFKSGSELVVGIIGGGLAGLYAALLLKSLGIKYEIFESRDEVGGRARTYRFDHEAIQDKKEWAYVDFGAMRFPHLPIMKRFFHLAENVDAPLDTYYYSLPTNLMHYNGQTTTVKHFEDEVHTDPLRFASRNNKGRGVFDSFADQGPGYFLNIAYKRLLELANEDFNKGFSEGIKIDQYSVRELLLQQDFLKGAVPLSTRIVTWLETLTVGTGMFDESALETLILLLDFAEAEEAEAEADAAAADDGNEEKTKKRKQPEATREGFVKYQDFSIPVSPSDWSLISGGTNVIAQKVLEKLSKTNLHLDSRILKIEQDKKRGGGVTLHYQPTTLGQDDDVIRKKKTFSHVISTVTLSVFQNIEVPAEQLSYHKRTAIRTLRYENSIKVAMLFKSRWWFNFFNIYGGQSSTDLPLRTVVYPSYPVYDPENPTDDYRNAAGVILASYLWANDANRLGAATSDKNGLIDLCLNNLAQIHFTKNGPFGSQKLFRDFLASEFLAVEHVDWNKDFDTAGAFAFFAPSQFSSMYPDLIVPEMDGRLHFAGEVASVHHGWIVGALTSAYRSVHEILIKENKDDLIAKLKGDWGEINLVEYAGVNIDKFNPPPHEKIPGKIQKTAATTHAHVSSRSREVLPVDDGDDGVAEGAADEDFPNLDNIQGDSLQGFNKPNQAFIFVLPNEDGSQADELRKLIAWALPNLEIETKTSFEILEHNIEFSKFRKATKLMDLSAESAVRLRSGEDTKRRQLLNAKWANISFSYKALLMIMTDAKKIFEDEDFEAFRQGMFARRNELNDPSDGLEITDKNAVVLIKVAAEEEGNLHEISNGVRRQLKKLGLTFRTFDAIDKLQGKEHFGWQDGVSQPNVWTKRRNGQIVPTKDGRPEYFAGEFVLGYKAGVRQQPASVNLLRADGKKLSNKLKDGTFQVVRRLQQHVPEFHRDLEKLGQKHNIPDLGDRLTGRRTDGEPLVEYDEKFEHKFNAFDFSDDKSGHLCPFVSHVRKMYPRADGFDPDTRRIIRRGTSYGPKFDLKGSPEEQEKERGLMFVCYQRDLKTQFEFLQQSWANNIGFPPGNKNMPAPAPVPDPTAPGWGFDIIIGQAKNPKDERHANVFQELAEGDDDGKPDLRHINFARHYVTHRGGGYFFVPSISLLKELAVKFRQQQP